MDTEVELLEENKKLGPQVSFAKALSARGAVPGRAGIVDCLSEAVQQLYQHLPGNGATNLQHRAAPLPHLLPIHCTHNM